jgi:hypothetical protein
VKTNGDLAFPFERTENDICNDGENSLDGFIKVLSRFAGPYTLPARRINYQPRCQIQENWKYDFPLSYLRGHSARKSSPLWYEASNSTITHSGGRRQAGCFDGKNCLNALTATLDFIDTNAANISDRSASLFRAPWKIPGAARGAENSFATPATGNYDS